MCSNKSLCHLFVALNVFTAAILVHGGGYSNSTFYYTRFGARAIGGGGRQRDEDAAVQMERMLRDVFGGVNASAGGRQKRFIHYDYSDNAVNLGMEFSVHFLSIPVKKTIDSAMGFLEAIPKTTVNLNALFIGILLAVVGVVANGMLDAKATSPWHSFRSAMGPLMSGQRATTMMMMAGAEDDDE